MKLNRIIAILIILGGIGFTHKAMAAGLRERLRGRILLQTESHGEAWYVNPTNDKRYYLKDGEAAFGLMRSLGLGITNENLAKIPIGVENRAVDTDTDSDGLPDKLEEGIQTDPTRADSDGDGFNDGQEINTGNNPLGSGKLLLDPSLAKKFFGRILLQVQSRGQAWYINPVDHKRYYLKDGPAAYTIMRFLSLGISNANLSAVANAVNGEQVGATPKEVYLQYSKENAGVSLANLDEAWKSLEAIGAKYATTEKNAEIKERSAGDDSQIPQELKLGLAQTLQAVTPADLAKATITESIQANTAQLHIVLATPVKFLGSFTMSSADIDFLKENGVWKINKEQWK